MSLIPPDDPLLTRPHSGRFTLSSADGKAVALMELATEVATIQFEAGSLIGSLRGGARLYAFTGKKGTVAKSLRRGPTVRLTGPGGEVVATASLRPEGIQLTAGESGAAYTVTATSPEGPIRVQRGDALAGTIRRETERLVIAGPDEATLFTAPLPEAPRRGAMWAPLLVKELEDTLRYTLAAELAARGL